tara:strand:- start:8144 stop:9004 length:861 start_codon:yes stop_codon:yes gene_type:complete
MKNKKIIIGTASLGLKYGFNKTKQNSRNSVAYLKKAYNLGIKEIDTSPAYGNSGKIINDTKKKFKIYTKLTKKLLKTNSKKIELSIKNFLIKSLKKFSIKEFEGVLIQNESIMLTKKGKKIFETLKKFKENKLIKNIGISSYNLKTLRKILKKYQFDFVQVPFNVFDQRLIEKKNLDFLNKKKIDIHVRSIFLQGLLLLDNNEIPIKFKKYKEFFYFWNTWLNNNNYSNLEACYNFVNGQKSIKKVVIGSANYNEFKNLFYCKEKKIRFPFKFKKIPENLFNPIRW